MPSTTQQIAADIVSRLPALSQDSPLNAAQTIEGMLETIAPVSVLAMEAKELRFKVAELKKERDGARAQVDMLNSTVLQLEAKRKAMREELTAENQKLRATCAELVTDGNAVTLAQTIVKLEAKCAEMREALMLAKDVTSHGFLPNPKTGNFNLTHFNVHDVIDHALSSDCGKGWIKAGELEFVEKYLQGLIGAYMATFHGEPEKHFIDAVNAAGSIQARVKQLIEKAQQ